MSRVDDRTLVLHIGLHKTATSYIQNVLSARRYDLLEEGVLYPLAGTGSLARGVDRLQLSTRDGAQSGHALFAGNDDESEIQSLVRLMLEELPDSASTVLLSAEDFTARWAEPQRILGRFTQFGTVKVVLVLRRQDTWIESYYKQRVDQHLRFETRSFAEYVEQDGHELLDFHARFSPWRDLVGPENFHVLSYDDEPGGGSAILRRLLEVAGVDGPLLDRAADIPVPRYESVRSIDTLGLRILNGVRTRDAERRVKAAREIYAAAPEGELELLTPELSAAIQDRYAAVNERIEAEWFTTPVPGFRFGKDLGGRRAQTPSADDLVAYLDQVMAISQEARKTGKNAGKAAGKAVVTAAAGGPKGTK